MVERVTQSFNGETKELEHKKDTIYEGETKAPEQQLKTAELKSYYPLRISAEDDAGNRTDEVKMVEVLNKPIFPIQMISATAVGEEKGYIECETDLDIGDTNDFEIRMSLDEWKREMCDYGYRMYVPDTEYGGILESMRVVTKSNEIVWSGHTWRGLLTQKVVEPPSGSDHLILNGELNDVIRTLIADRFGSLFVVPKVNTKVTLNNWQVDRYVSLYNVIMKFLDAKGHRLQISYRKEEGHPYGYVEIQAVPVVDYSDYLQYDQDCNINFDIKDYRMGINHLVCVGKGQNEERIVLHLYVQQDGSVGRQQYYTGLAERAAVYDFSSAELEQLEEDGAKRLKELQNYKSVDLTIDDIDLEMGDIIGGREQITGTSVVKPIIGKILKIKDGRAEIEYKIKGDE